MEFDKFEHLGDWAMVRFKACAFHLGTSQKEIHIMNGGKRVEVWDDNTANRYVLQQRKIPLVPVHKGHAPRPFIEKPAREMFINRFRIEKIV